MNSRVDRLFIDRSFFLIILFRIQSCFKFSVKFAFCSLLMTSKCAISGEISTNLENLCTQNEKVYFSCVVKNKIISLCGTPAINKDIGFLQYRFGLPNHPPELTYPVNKKHPSNAFVNSLQVSAQTFSYEIGFKINDYEYRIFVDEAARYSSLGYGLFIKQGNLPTKTLRCSKGTVLHKEDFSSFYEHNVIPKVSPID